MSISDPQHNSMENRIKSTMWIISLHSSMERDHSDRFGWIREMGSSWPNQMYRIRINQMYSLSLLVERVFNHLQSNQNHQRKKIGLTWDRRLTYRKSLNISVERGQLRSKSWVWSILSGLKKISKTKKSHKYWTRINYSRTIPTTFLNCWSVIVLINWGDSCHILRLN